MESKYKEVQLFTSKRLWLGLENGILKEIEKKLKGEDARRLLPYELSPVTSRNLAIAMNYYFPEISDRNYKNMTSRITSLKPMNGYVSEDETKDSFNKISNKINVLLGEYPKANMDVVESYIITTMLHIPYAIQECNPVYSFNPIKNMRTHDYKIFSHIGLLNIILAVNIEGWLTSDHENNNNNLFEWLRAKLKRQADSIIIEKKKPRI